MIGRKLRHVNKRLYNFNTIMKLSKNQKILIGVFTVVPLILSLVLVAWIFFEGVQIIERIEASGNEPSIAMLMSFMAPVIVASVVLSIIGMVLLVIYMVHIVKNDRLDMGMKILWIVMIFLLGNLAMPVYWFSEMWEGKEELPSDELGGERIN